MTKKAIEDITGYSNSGIDAAIQNALDKTGAHVCVKVVETCSSHIKDHHRQYHVTLATCGVQATCAK